MVGKEFAVYTTLPDCSNCGANSYIGGYFLREGQLFRCEDCKTCFKPRVTVELTATIEPYSEEAEVILPSVP